MARASSVLVSELPWARYGCICEKLSACCFPIEWTPWARTGQSHPSVWQSRERCIHNGLRVPNFSVPGLHHLPQQLRHKNCPWMMHLMWYKIFQIFLYSILAVYILHSGSIAGFLLPNFYAGNRTQFGSSCLPSSCLMSWLLNKQLVDHLTTRKYWMLWRVGCQFVDAVLYESSSTF